MYKNVTLLGQSTGLNVLVDPVRLKYDPEMGQQELAVALNVDIDRTGRISRRKGFDRVNSSSCHSLWSGASKVYCVSGGYICLVNEDYSFTQLAALTHRNERVWFLDVNKDVFWSNGFENGVLLNGVAPQSWDLLLPQSDSDDRFLSAMPVGRHLELYSGRIWASKNNALFCSEPLGFYACDMTRNWFLFESDLQMVAAVEDGLYVSTSDEVSFLRGPTPGEFQKEIISSSPVIQGTVARVDGRMVLSGEVPKTVLMWTALDGIYAGFPSGQAVNMTKDKLQYPEGNSGSAVFMRDAYLSLIDP